MDIQNLVIWGIGFVIYRILMKVDIIVGNTLPDMAVTILICITAEKGKTLRLKGAKETVKWQ